MKFICIRPIKLEKGYFIQDEGEKYEYINWNETTFIEAGEYKVRHISHEYVTLKNIRIRINDTENIKTLDSLRFNKNALVDNGYFEGGLLEKVFYKEVIEYLNRKDLYWENMEKRKTIEEAKKILADASQEVLVTLPVWMKCNIILKDLKDHFIEDDSDVPEGFRFDKVNEILKHPCKNDEYDYNIFDEINSVQELKDLQDTSNAAEYDIGPKRKEICKKCGHPFYLTKGELDWYFARELKIPKTCQYCRKGIKRPEMIYPENTNFNESLEEEPVKTEMQIALEKAGITVTEQK